MEFVEVEYMVCVMGYIFDKKDIEIIFFGVNDNGILFLIRDIVIVDIGL